MTVKITIFLDVEMSDGLESYDREASFTDCTNVLEASVTDGLWIVSPDPWKCNGFKHTPCFNL